MDWNIGRSSRTCAATGTPIADGDVFFSALSEEGDKFVRRDYSPEAWPDVDKSGFFSYWKSKRAEGGAGSSNQVVVDVERFFLLFDRLEGTTDPSRLLLRYVIALMLTRKRALRLDATNKTPEGEVLVLWDRRTNRPVDVLSPEVDAAQVAAVQEELNQLFDNHLDA